MKKVLIIDDDRVLRETLAAALEAEGYAVAEAADGREGLNKALKGGFDLIVLDVVMPALGGLEVCRKLREAGHQVPVSSCREEEKRIGQGPRARARRGRLPDQALRHGRVHRPRPRRPEAVEARGAGARGLRLRGRGRRLPEEERHQSRAGPAPDRPRVQSAPAPGRVRGPGRLPGDHPQQVWDYEKFPRRGRSTPSCTT